MTVTLDDIKQAASNIQGDIENTPLAHSHTRIFGISVKILFPESTGVAKFSL